MNIRMGGGSVRYRISCEELRRLLEGGRVEETLVLAGKPVLLTVESSGGDELICIYEEGWIGLKTPKKSLQELEQKGRRKEGIVSTADGSTLSLQVDLKTYLQTKQG